MTLPCSDPGCIRTFPATVTGNDGYLTRIQAALDPGPASRLLVSQLASTELNHDPDCTPRASNGHRLPAQSLTVDLHPAGRIRHGAGLDLAIAAAVLAGIGVLLVGMAQP